MTATPLSDLNVIITGATGGLGRVLARIMWRCGANLLLTGRSEQRLNDLGIMLPSAASSRQSVHCMAVDLAACDAARLIMSRARKLWGRLDVLVNNAASLGPVGAAHECDWFEWQAAIGVDLLAPVELCMLAVPLMGAGGSIVNLSGGGATGPRPRFSAYATAKAGLVRFSETLAAELQKSRIRVNCVAPGVMNTGMLRSVADAGPERAGDAEFSRALEHTSVNACANAAELVVWLASPASAGITGRLISATWDNWKQLPLRAPELASTDIYTLRRIVPNDRGLDWN